MTLRTISLNQRIYHVDAEDDQTILEILKNTPIEFRCNCEYGKCGSCGAVVDSNPVLLCQERIGSRKEISLSPLSSFPVIRDLIVDFDFKFLTQLDRPKISEDYKEMQMLRRCKECFLCLEQCASFKAIQTHLPMVLNKNLVRKSIEQALQNHLFLCSSCGKCAEVCPAEIDIFGKVVRRLRKLSDRSSHSTHSIIEDRILKTGRSVHCEIQQLFRQEFYPAINSKKDSVILFVGCLGLAKSSISKINEKYIKLLNFSGFDVYVPSEQICCGSPLWRVGLDHHFEEIRFRNTQSISVTSKLHDVSLITSLCPGCLSMLSSEYSFERPQIVQPIELIESLPIKEEFDQITFHNPCHNSKEANERIIEVIGRSLDVKQNSICCGAGGGVRSFDKEISTKIGELAKENILKHGSDKIVTACNFCLLQLNELLDLKVLHFIELFDHEFSKN